MKRRRAIRMVLLLGVCAIPQLLFTGCSSTGQTVGGSVEGVRVTCGDAGDGGCVTTATTGGGGGW